MSIEDDIIVKRATPEQVKADRSLRQLAQDIVGDVFPSMDAALAVRYVEQVERRLFRHYAAREREAGTGLICAEWRRLSDGCVARCDRPSGHEGGHLDSVIDIAWPVRTAQGEPHD